MITPGFSVLQSPFLFRRPQLWRDLAAEDVTLSSTVLAAALAASWGWRLAKLSLVAQPRGASHWRVWREGDSHVRRTKGRESQPGTRSVLLPYLKDSLASMGMQR